jgi:hypothetical protein
MDARTTMLQATPGARPVTDSRKLQKYHLSALSVRKTHRCRVTSGQSRDHALRHHSQQTTEALELFHRAIPFPERLRVRASHVIPANGRPPPDRRCVQHNPVSLVVLCPPVDLRVRDAHDRLDEIQRAAPLGPRLARL